MGRRCQKGGEHAWCISMAALNGAQSCITSSSSTHLHPCYKLGSQIVEWFANDRQRLERTAGKFSTTGQRRDLLPSQWVTRFYSTQLILTTFQSREDSKSTYYVTHHFCLSAVCNHEFSVCISAYTWFSFYHTVTFPTKLYVLFFNLKTHLYMWRELKSYYSKSWEARYLRWSVSERHKRNLCSDSQISLNISAHICVPDTLGLTPKSPTPHSFLENFLLPLLCFACFLIPLVWAQCKWIWSCFVSSGLTLLSLHQSESRDPQSWEHNKPS